MTSQGKTRRAGRNRNPARVTVDPQKRNCAAANKNHRPRLVQAKLPMTDELTERDFKRLEAAAERQMERNRRRIG